jgi:N-acetylglucosamine repressor
MRKTGDLKLIQELNRSIILETIRISAPISRSEIARKNSLSPTTVTSAVNDLIREGFVKVEGTGQSKGGRKPILLRFSPNNHFLIGVSISNTAITVAEMNLESVITRTEVYHFNSIYGRGVTDYIIASIGRYLGHYSDLTNCIGISIISSGIVDAVSGVIRYNSQLRLQDVPLKELVEKEFSLKTLLDNDTNAMAIAEKQHATENNRIQNLIYVMIGDGVGAGIIVNGTIFRGHHGGAGEFGHTIVDRGGIRCDCGNRGCLERYVSWPAIYSRIVTAITEGKGTKVFDLADRDLANISPSVFRVALEQGDDLLAEIIDDLASYLSVGLVNLINLFNPKVIVIGGDMLHNNEDFLKKLNHNISNSALDTLTNGLEIRPTSLGEDFKLIGAASVLLHEVFDFSFTT